MIIERATISDIPRMLEIFEAAKKYMRANGNASQWGDDYPAVSSLENDIAHGGSYIIKKDGVIVATFALLFGEDPTYPAIMNGEWLNDKEYGVVHRIASDGSVRGIANLVFDWAKDRCQELSCDFRVDTHEDNLLMQKAILAHGFVYCGVVKVANGTLRLAYHLPL